ncbi:PLP-dependent aminotransferase family protein [Vagococcus salmoninarum]|uniref:aminotransferase-like domain-containing protein n=1 Tax=Vagococcus salmoninarum TaxID=2739 RepID=UPI0028D4EF34|nr:PLP-dependent aminotransferase family protein [Vagococcus salmoninarum]
MWELTRLPKQPIYQSIVQLILEHIKTGRLLPGEKLPPERELATLFGVNRSTVVHGLDELEAMGVIIRKQGSGTLVNEGKWGVYTGSRTNWRTYLAQGSLKESHPYLAKLQGLVTADDPELIDGFTGELPLDLIPSIDLPNISWKEFINEEKRQDLRGYQPLRQGVIKQLAQENHLMINDDELLITSGAQQALFLIIHVLLKNGDGVAIEDPSSFYGLSLFQGAGIRLFGVPLDSEGMKLTELEELIIRRKIKLVLVNPNLQNPTGKTMSESRRQNLVALCGSYHIPIVEDDVFGQLFFDKKRPVSSLKELDPNNVIYIGSLSKILGGTTKIGWLSAPNRVVLQLAEAHQGIDASLSVFPQVLASYALQDQTYESKLVALRQSLCQRRDRLVALLAAELGDKLTFEIPLGGYFLWVTVISKELKQTDYDLLLKNKILISPSFLFGGDYQSMRINFARLTEDQSSHLVSVLKQMLA